MTHLTDEQFEDILHGRIPIPDHLTTCQECRARLAEKRALASRLHRAMNGVTPSVNLEQSIRNRLASDAGGKILSFSKYRRYIQSHKRALAATLSTAAAALILVPLMMVSLAPQPAHAALVQIHEHNLSGDHEFFAETDPDKLAAYFKDNLGFDPQLPRLESGLQLRGCCVRHFKGDIVGSYVMDSPEGYISVVVVSDLPQNLGMKEGSVDIGSHTYWKAYSAKCYIVSARIEGYTYCAIADTSYDHLLRLLEQLLPDARN